MNIQLCPVQQQAFDTLIQQRSLNRIFELFSPSGNGCSKVLQRLHLTLGGTLLQMRDFVDRLQQKHPLALEETFEQMVMTALTQYSVVLIDDLHLLNQIVLCSHAYPRSGLLNLALLRCSNYAEEADKTLVFGYCSDYGCGSPLSQRAYQVKIEPFGTADYAFFCHYYLNSSIAATLNYDRIFRFASNLNGYQLKNSCLQLRQEATLDTDQFIEYLRSRYLISNVNLGEVQTVDLNDLKGVDEILQSLEANLILPLENDELTRELNLQPKRGVLLAGPPGTGKTTIGRALAHRLKSKFFLIDGTFISGTGAFYGGIQQVFEAAKQNAPAIVFIDDTDVIFENGDETGLYRYLLTILDGLESESVGQVCVMMTAMNVANLPPALVRSGRIELWLETRLPDTQARAAILMDLLDQLPPGLGSADLEPLVMATDGLTGADLKRLVADGKTLYAYDKAHNQPLRSPTDYFLTAIEGVLANKERYAEAAHHQPLLHTSRSRLMKHPHDFSQQLEAIAQTFLENGLT